MYSSIYVSICGVVLCIQTNLLLHVPLNHYSFYLFVFGATLAHYNLHYLVKKTGESKSERFDWSQKNKQLHKGFICVGLMVCIYCLFFFRLHNFIFLGLLGIVAFFYSYPALPFKRKKRLKEFGLLKICTLSLLWTMVTVWFPMLENDIAETPFQLVFVRRFIFMFTLCLLFDIRDIINDRSFNIRTIPVRIGIEKSYLLAYGLVITFLLISVYELTLTSDIVIFNALFLSAISSLFLIRFSRKYPSDYIYLAGVDGLMILQGLLVAIGSI